MSNKRFFSLVRQYATLAQRMRRSYVLQVQEILDLRQAEIESSDLPAEEKEQLLSQNVAFVQREYGSVDFAWGDSGS